MTIAFAYELLKLFVVASMGLILVVAVAIIFGLWIYYGFYDLIKEKKK